MTDRQMAKTRQEKIDALLAMVQTGEGASFAGERLNHQERRFFLRHPDMVFAVLDGDRSHVRVNVIARKMSHHGLGIDDVEAIWQALSQRRRNPPEHSGN